MKNLFLITLLSLILFGCGGKSSHHDNKDNDLDSLNNTGSVSNETMSITKDISYPFGDFSGECISTERMPIIVDVLLNIDSNGNITGTLIRNKTH